MRDIIIRSCLCWILACSTSFGQATIRTEKKLMDTYGFRKPDPVPVIAEDPKIAPYFKFHEYDTEPTPREWTVVTLENDYIQVFILPEIGGKVWGAIEKSTGNEFLYRNEVVKFRNISMRGPWTSGGIEFNFGIIGHHPSTATPVNYLTRENEDGSVSCFVGNEDLPSNTFWQVEIRLGPENAFFETHASWYNASPLTEAYYNWMTGAAQAAQDLEFFIPGNAYLEHNGQVHPWPIDTLGRNLAFYKNNDFGPSKSYHIVGMYDNYFGGYYHDRGVGFGHGGDYDAIPGQKLWLWALSRAGGIWEDLLTDTDGQYIEFQAGRLFNQYFPGAENPIGQFGFAPHLYDHWSEFWFPVKGIGGIKAVSREGVLNIENKDGNAVVLLNPLQELDHDLVLLVNGSHVSTERVRAIPMEIFQKVIPFEEGQQLEVRLQDTELRYSSDSTSKILKRPFDPVTNHKEGRTERLYQDVEEAMEYREYSRASKLLDTLLKEDPSQRKAWTKRSALEYRRGAYQKALEAAHTALKMETYHPEANYMAALAYKALGDTLNAIESAGWSARDIAFRSVSYDLMAELHLAKKEYDRALEYANESLAFNSFNVNAMETRLVALRKKGDRDEFDHSLVRIRKSLPLHHFSAVEAQFLDGASKQLQKWDFLKNEMPWESILAVALRYLELNLTEEALAVLELAKGNMQVDIWIAYLKRHDDMYDSNASLSRILEASVEMVFPFRREGIEPLIWASRKRPHWKFDYLLAQNYIAVGQKEKGFGLLEKIGEEPTLASFYRFRSKINEEKPVLERIGDLEKAVRLETDDWKNHEELIQFLISVGLTAKALEVSARAYGKFGKNYNIGLAHAKSLLRNNKPNESLKVLKKLHVLPYEHASESKQIYNEAHYALIMEALKNGDYDKATSLLDSVREWPENLGVGKPFETDERIEDFVMAMILAEHGKKTEANLFLDKILAYRDVEGSFGGKNVLFSLMTLMRKGRAVQMVEVLKQAKKAAQTDQETAIGVGLYEKDRSYAREVAPRMEHWLALAQYLNDTYNP